MKSRTSKTASKPQSKPTRTAPAMNADGVPLARVRRAPKVWPFLVTGFVLGAVIGLVLSMRAEGGNYEPASASGYMAVLFGGLGLLLGGVVFVVADRRA